MNLINKYKAQIEKVAIDDTPKTMHDKRMDKIRLGGLNKNLLKISYTDNKGNKSKRLVEPYKLTDDDFWGFDVTKSQIRRFKTRNIKGITPTKQQYEARWDIEI